MICRISDTIEIVYKGFFPIRVETFTQMSETEGRGCVKVNDKSIRLKLKVLRQHGRWKPQIDNFLRWLSTVTSDRF